ncbi:MAG TPA: hypothetical protein VFM77_00075, partial [Terriglobales bacterium]|nr:hypothetical protein [Terriglobales bacterium]
MHKIFTKLLLLFALASPCFLSAATCAPILGLGNLQAFDNNGKPLTSGVLYSFQAGTSTQQATYTDSTCTTTNANPVTFASGARANVWLNTGQTYKFVLCAQNDGAACAPSDTLFSVDQVPGGSTGGGGGGGSPFISGSANPATTGILRLASGDSICFRNAANNANLCLSKDANDILSLFGPLKIPETVCSNTGVGFDYLCADNSTHRLKIAMNGGSQFQVPVAGADINTSDQIVGLHFGSTGTPLSPSAPTTNQVLQWNGSSIVGAGPLEQTVLWCGAGGGCGLSSAFAESSANGGTEVFFASAHTLVRFTYNLSTSPSGCGTASV